MYNNIKILREHPETARAGLKWEEEESQELMNRIKDGMSLEDIANIHKRTVSGVKNRIMTNALNILKEKKISLDEVSKLVNISVFDLENYKEKIDKKELDKKESDKKESDKKESDNLSSQQMKKLELEIKKLELENKKLELEIKKLQ
jgi:hypothetical protein